MKSQRWSTCVYVLAFALVLASAGSARAQSGFSGISGYPSASPFVSEYGTGIGWGATPYNYGSFGGLSYGGPRGINAFPGSSFGLSTGPRPQTRTSFQSVSNAVTLVPGWNGPTHRVQRRRNVQPTALRR